MSFIRNEDFSYLVNSDRNVLSRKSYGVLPIRDISLTPYGIPLQMVLDVPQAGDANAVLQVVANDLVVHPPQPNHAILGEIIGDAVVQDGNYNQEIIDISDSQGDVDSLGSFNIEPEDISGSLPLDEGVGASARWSPK